MSTRSATPFGGKYGVVGWQMHQSTGHDHTTRQQPARDPVGGMEVSPGEATASAEVDQRRYRFLFKSLRVLLKSLRANLPRQSCAIHSSSNRAAGSHASSRQPPWTALTEWAEGSTTWLSGYRPGVT